MKVLLILLLLFISIPAAAQNSAFKVGVTTRSFSDDSRTDWMGTAPRPLLTSVWYPADKDAVEREISIGSPDKPLFIAGRAASEAKISSSVKRYPLVVLSHGTGGSALQLMWLGEFLASHGFIVAAANHHGNTAAEGKYTAQAFFLWWERSRDLQITIDKMLADAEFGARIDQNKIGVAGFSLGGATVVAVAGGVFNPPAFEKFCASAERDATCEPQPEFPSAPTEFEKIKDKDEVVVASLKRARNSYLDKRVKAVFAIAPALGNAFPARDLAQVKIPVEIVVGANDATTPAKTNAENFHRLIKNSRLTILPGEVGHYVFLSECTAAGRESLPICRDGATVNRAAVHQQVSEMALKFFRNNL